MVAFLIMSRTLFVHILVPFCRMDVLHSLSALQAASQAAPGGLDIVFVPQCLSRLTMEHVILSAILSASTTQNWFDTSKMTRKVLAVSALLLLPSSPATTATVATYNCCC